MMARTKSDGRTTIHDLCNGPDKFTAHALHVSLILTQQAYLGSSQYGNSPMCLLPDLREQQQRIQELIGMWTADK
jgi:hypothetical protein